MWWQLPLHEPFILDAWHQDGHPQHGSAPHGHGSSTLYDQHFAMGLSHDDLRRKSAPETSCKHNGSLQPTSKTEMRPGFSEIWNTKDYYKVRLDAAHFGLKDLTVRTVDNYLVIEGHHDEQEDEHGLVARGFARVYIVPRDVDLKSFSASFDEHGVLTMEAPKKTFELSPDAISIQVPIASAASKDDKFIAAD